MGKSLADYADWLEERDLIWPKVSPPKPPKAKSFTKHIPGIRAVTWNLYGTLLRIADGNLLFDHEQDLRMQVAMDKTIKEFNMWQSMTRRPGAPWEYLLPQYRDIVANQAMQGTPRGDFPEIDSSVVWRRLVGKLEQKDYSFDTEIYNDFDDLSIKAGFFFHKCLQGVDSMPHALKVMRYVVRSGREQSLLADAQPFSTVQLAIGLRTQGSVPPMRQLLSSGQFALSYREGVRKPSKSLFRRSVQAFAEAGIRPDEILHIGSRIDEDIAPARDAGMRTALFAGDADSLTADREAMQDPKRKPDRLMTDLRQIRSILDGESAA